MMIRVAKTIDARISMLASRTTSRLGRRSLSLRRAFSRRRRNTFSTSITASSTNAPTAIAMPPIVIALSECPNASSTSNAAIKDSGSAVRVMAVARRLSRKSPMIATTSRAPSRSACRRLSSETSMKSAWRRRLRCKVEPGGSSDSIPSSAASSKRVNSRVFTSGCFWMPSTMPGSSITAPVPRTGRAASITVLRSATRTGAPGPLRTTTPATSSRSCRRLASEITYSPPPEVAKPADTVRLAASSAAEISKVETPCRAMRTGSSRTWNSRASPPITLTCATPGTASRRRRSTRSAKSRNSSGSPSPPVRPANRTSPMMEVTGPRVGLPAASGSDSAASAIFSATV